MSKTYALALVLALGVAGCSKADGTPSGASVATTLVSGMEPGLSGTVEIRGENVAWTTNLVSSSPYTIQYMAGFQEGTFTQTYTVKPDSACKYNVSAKLDVSGANGEHQEHETKVDFSTLKDVKSEAALRTFKVLFGDACALKSPVCLASIDVANFILSLEQMQKAVSDMKVICKPS
ncbi:hypothetical protein [Rhizobium sp. ZPR3]|uniref:Uncharacterized protein n=2 Tax=unclassified Rhizobium TaxID=2613769 RepID=A0AAU7SF09_9HYPH